MQSTSKHSKHLLSLESWPNRPLSNSSTVSLTPITKRILAQTSLQPQNLLSLSYQQFLQTCSSNPENKYQLEEYGLQVQRRKKMVQILKQIRKKYVEGEDYGQKSKRFKRSRKKDGSRSSHQQYLDQLGKSRNCSNRSGSNASSSNRKMSRVTSGKSNKLGHSKCSHKVIDKLSQPYYSRQRQQSEYFNGFQAKMSHSPKLISSCLPEEEIAKDNMLLAQPPSQYGCIAGKASHFKQRKQSKIPPNSRKNSSRHLCQQLLTTINQWEAVDRHHIEEINKNGLLSNTERERLGKKYSVEKSQVGRKMEKLKGRLKSEGKR